MTDDKTLKLCIRVVVDKEGNYAVGTEHEYFDELASDANLTHPVATYELELEVPVPAPVRATASIGGEASRPSRLTLK